MTIRDRVLEVVKQNPASSFTNSQLARTIGRPEPSVRRAALELERQGYVYNSEWRYPAPLAWRYRGQQ